MIDIKVHERGPVVEGHAEHIIGAGVDKAEEQVAEKGAQMVRTNLDGVLKHPTGFYRSNVQAEGDRITDNGVIYGPWLEGTGSRNRTTRFKGYFTFRRTTQELEARSGEIANDALDPYIRRIS